ncbi:MAG: hypothetical protein J6A62_01690 [Oscillospiraceae bacterium]|nr:hypothetical protein [Oscillospiraceae bacterium]
MSKRIYVSIFWVVLGGVLAALGLAGRIEGFWGSMGVALVIIGLLRIVLFIRYQRDEEYREAVDVQNGDERNRFLANKAWAWAGYWLVFLCGVGTIVFKLLGREDLMMFSSGIVCLMLVLYWACYTVLKRKY